MWYEEACCGRFPAADRRIDADELWRGPVDRGLDDFGDPNNVRIAKRNARAESHASAWLEDLHQCSLGLLG